jgi:hypothetical protein
MKPAGRKIERTGMVDMAAEERNIRLTGALALGVIAVTGAVFWFAWPPLFGLPQTLAERLAFAALCAWPLFVCVTVAIMIVGLKRRTSPEDIAGSAAAPPSERIRLDVAVLQNTLEQAVIAASAYLAVAALAQGRVLAMLPAAALCFVIGRVFFRAWYFTRPTGRGFGMNLTMQPSLYLHALAAVLLAARLF